jgi:hypothetical protein
MAPVGMIHLACYCGAELFYLGERPANLTNHEIIEILHQRLGPGDFGILTATEDLHGECPFCGLIYELPEPRLMKQLPYSEHGRVRSALTDYRQARGRNAEFGPDLRVPSRYIS